jgi:hypothetical protein
MSRHRSQPHKLGETEVLVETELTIEEARVAAAAIKFIPAVPSAGARTRAVGESARAKLLRAIEAAGAEPPPTDLEASVRRAAE